MSQAARIKRNSLFTFLSNLVRLLANILIFVGIARLYGPVEFGQFTAAHTLATVFLVLADFGFDVLLTTEVARQRHRASELAQVFFSMKFLFALGATGGMLVIAYFQNVSDSTRVLMYVLSTYVLFSALTNFFFALFKGFEEMHHETKISFVINAVLLVTVVALGIMRAPLVAVAGAFVASRILALVLTLVVACKKVPVRRFRLTIASRSDLVLICVFGFQALFGNLFFVQDTLLLSFWKGDHEVGIYQSVFKLVSLALIMQDVIINTMLPVFSQLHANNEKRWVEMGDITNRTLTILGLPVALIFLVYADQLIRLIYGPTAFSEAIPILRVFGIIVLVRFAAETYALMLTTSRRQSSRMLVVAVATGANYLLNLYAIPRYGAYGAAIISLVTNVLVGAGYVAMTRKFFIPWVMNYQNGVPVVLTILLGIILWPLRDQPIWYTAPAAIAIYLAVSYSIGYSKEERNVVFAVDRGILRGKQVE
jgi:O-antigen/teichoic acid export membrane protein